MTGVELGSAAPAGLLERERELATAREWLDGVSAGRGGMLLIEAPAGLGKSSLIEQISGLAADEFFVLSGAGREVEQELGWGVARSLFEPWVLRISPDERDDLLSGPAASASLLFTVGEDASGMSASDVGFGILHGLYWLTARAAENRPALLIIDDAHWADEPSLRLLVYLLGRIPEEAIGLLVAARTGEPGAAGLLAQLAGERAVRILEPAPLSAAAVSALIKARMPNTDASFARRCWELTAGNPLGVRELLLAIADLHADAARPDVDVLAARAARSLSRSVLRRLASLSPDARALADAVSVFEVRVELQWAAALADLEPSAALAAADQLARVDILTGEDPLAFTHPLLRTAVYQALARGHRSQLHRRAAAVLLGASASAEQVAGHLLESPPVGDPEVVELLRRAARQAMAHGVPASAARYLERARREPPSDATRGSVLAELGRAQASFAPRQAIEHLEEAMDLADGPAARAALALELGRALHDAGRPEEACAAFERGAAELGDDGGDLALELEAWYLTSAVLLPERAADARRRTDAIVARSRDRSTPAVRLLASKSLIMRVYEGQPHEPLVELALELYGEGRLIDEGGVLSQASTHIAGTLSYGDRYAEALEVLDRARDEARRIGSLTGIAAACQLRARLRHWTGPIPDVIADASTAVEIFSSGQQMYLPASTYCLARGLIEDDQLDAADGVLATVERDAPPTGIFGAWQHEARGRLAAATGDHERAFEEFLACGRWTDTLLVGNPAMFHWRSEAGLAALRLGDPDRARELIDAEAALAARFGAPRAIAVAERAAALIERGPAAEDGLRSAAEKLRGCGAFVELAYTRLELGGAIRRAGRPTEARDTLREALALAEEIGARRAARLGREELQRAGGRASSRAEADQLTPSERRVAELAAQGRTNREIANELFVTIKAVEWHLGNAYRKLDIRGRGGLAEALGKSV
jgi:DNA-binding CsgD family transcriptional regulator